MKRRRTLAETVREQFESSPGRLLVYFWGVMLLLFLVFAGLLLLASPWIPKDEPPTIELEYLGGPTGIPVEANFVPALLHSGLSLALLLILAGIYRLTKKLYVAYWAGALGSFFFLYVYMLMRIYFVLVPEQRPGTIQLPRWDLYWTDLFSFGSTILILLTGLLLLRIELSLKQQLYLAATIFLGLFVHHAASILPRSQALLPGGVLSLAAVWVAGYGLYGRMRGLDGQAGIGTGFLVLFVMYGLIQPMILFISTPPLSIFVTTGAYILKALCTGFIIFLVLNETWQEKEKQLREVQEGKEGLGRILNENNLGYFRANRDGLLLDANQAEARLLGYDSPEDIKGKINRLSIIEDQGEREGWAVELTRHGTLWNHPNRIRTLQEEVRYFRTNCQAFPSGEDGELPGFEGIDRDVTAEVLLDLEKERQGALLEGFNDAFSSSNSTARFFAAILDIVTQQTCATSAAFLLIGEETEIPAKLLIVQVTFPHHPDAVGRVYQIPTDLDEDLTGADPSPLGAQIATALFGAETAEEKTIQIPMLRLDQQHGLVILRASRANLGDVEGRQEALRQFLARAALNYPHVLRGELQTLRQKIRSFLSQPEELGAQMGNVVHLLREELSAEDLRLALRLWRDGELMFFPREVDSTDSHQATIPLVGEIPSTPRQIWQGIEGDTASGESLLAEAVIPICDRYYKPFGYLLICNPRSGGARVSALSVVDVEKLLELSEVIGVVAEGWVSVYNMTKLLETTTHEFRAPAVAIRNTVDVLRKNWSSYPSERIHRKLTDINLDSSLLIGLTNNLDTLQGRSVGKQSKIVSLFQDIIFKTVRQLRPLAQRLSYEHEGAHRFPAIQVVEEDLSQIVFNLVHNAIKYARDGSVRMRFVGGQEGDLLTLKVQDWGIGVPPGYEKKIFEREVRAPNALKSNVIGMGMGLAVSLDLAHQMDGDIRLTRPGDPTEFTLYIPKKHQVSSEVTR